MDFQTTAGAIYGAVHFTIETLCCSKICKINMKMSTQ